MKRKNKNILSIIVLIILCISTVVTGYLYINNSNSTQKMQNITGIQDGNNENQPPEKPSGNNTTNSSESDNNSQNNSSSIEKNDDNMQTPPEIPSENNRQQNSNNNDNNTVYKVVFGVECLLISMVIMYLVMSKFNKNDIKETFKNNDKKVIYFLSIIIMTTVLMLIVNKTTANLVDKSNNNQNINNNGNSITYKSSNEITESTTKDSGEYTSTKSDENALSVSGNINANLSNINVSKTGDSNGGDNTSFYGINSAAIRTDRGGGTVTVEKGTYKTNGQGSPTIYSTADVTVKNASLTATSSEGVVIEGKNKVTLNNVKLTDTNNKLNGKSTTYKNIFLYQSMSGDAASGVSEFTSIDSTIITNKGDTIYVTNTKSKITLTNNKITNNDKTGNFLRVQKDSWGNNDSNGGDVSLVLSNQKINGNIVVDSISTLDMSMSSTSYYEGSINNDNNAKEVKLSLDKSSKIKLTGDSYVTSLDNKDSTNSNIDFNGCKLYVSGKAIN